MFAAALFLLHWGGAGGEPAAPIVPNVRIVHLGGSTSGLTWGAGALWATGGDRVARIDPATMAVRKTARIDALCDDSQLAVGFGAVWVTSGHCGVPGRLVEIDAKTLRVLRVSAAPTYLEGVAVWRGKVWLTTPFDGPTLLEFDPRTARLRSAGLEVGGEVSTGLFAPRLSSLLPTAGQLWSVVGGRGSGLLRITENRGRVRGVGVHGARPLVPTQLAATGSVVWAVFGTTIAPLSADSGRQVGRGLRPADQPLAIAGGTSEVWIATPRLLYRGSIRTPILVRSARLPFRAEALAVGGGYVWIASAGDAVARLGDPPVVS